jgi:hypothetical protein
MGIFELKKIKIFSLKHPSQICGGRSLLGFLPQAAETSKDRLLMCRRPPKARRLAI